MITAARGDKPFLQQDLEIDISSWLPMKLTPKSASPLMTDPSTSLALVSSNLTLILG
jgi:hypothetical protein